MICASSRRQKWLTLRNSLAILGSNEGTSSQENIGEEDAKNHYRVFICDQLKSDCRITPLAHGYAAESLDSQDS